MNRIAIALVAFVAWTLLAFWAGWEWRDRSADIRDLRAANKRLTAQVAEANRALAAERTKAAKLADIGRQYEQDKLAAQAAAYALVGDLRAGNVRLRNELGALYTASLSGTAAHSAELGAAAQRGAELAAAAVGVGAACDARDKAWRAVAEADRL